MSSLNPGLRSYIACHDAFLDGSDTPRAFLDRCLSVIDTREDDVQAFVCADFNAARHAADASTARWQSGSQVSAIDGMPIGVKDIMETADLPTEQGSPLFKGWRGGRDCAAVAALREAGAIIVGKTVTTEFAASYPGKTRNPWDLARTPGGSSSGAAAAVGCGMLPGSTASQVIGSTIRPASFCGAYGYKPSVGGINRGGSFDGFSQSCTGMIAASLAECWSMTREITSRTGGDPGYVGVTGPMTMPAPRMPRKLALLRTAGWANASPAAQGELHRARDAAAAAGVEVLDHERAPELARFEAAIENAMALSNRINTWEGRWPLDTYARDMDAAALSQYARERLADARSMSQEIYQGLLTERAAIRDLYAALQEKFDACMTLAAPGAAPQGLAWTGDPAFTVATSLIGMPAVTLPVLKDQGLPLGLQVIGFVDQDATLFAHADALQSIFNP
ncbi:MAG: amidase [Pseudomonadota bacterium]|nr:amidase [Pseudomonadota bacterium]